MSKVMWYVNRLRAMSVGEILWRMNQKRLCQKEMKSIMGRSILDPALYPEVSNLAWNGVLGEVFIGERFPKARVSPFPRDGGCWPCTPSYQLQYKQRDDIGDARLAWEPDRHFQYAQLAAMYGHDRDLIHLETLKDGFYRWVSENPVLEGIAWTSVMEAAIRAMSWLACLGLLQAAKAEEPALMEDLKTGILNMTAYVANHYSRFSSANNHLIVEMAVMGMVGDCVDRNQWSQIAEETLLREIPSQTSADGVNKEQSIHYQTFVMEALALYLLFRERGGRPPLTVLQEQLHRMGIFVSALIDINDEISEIGDNDAGRVLHLVGSEAGHYAYVLQLAGMLLGKDYGTKTALSQELMLLFPQKVLEQHRAKADADSSCSFPDGGWTVLKHRTFSSERLLTFDHAELALGSIAAHGHADALGITLRVNGHPILIDPGTYIYHIEKPWRDYFRTTLVHNTVTIDNRDQSEMKGPFLWGKRAGCTLMACDLEGDALSVMARHDGYESLGVRHARRIDYLQPDQIIITDILEATDGKPHIYALTFVPDYGIALSLPAEGEALLSVDSVQVRLILDEGDWTIEEQWISKVYGEKEAGCALRSRGTFVGKKVLKTQIVINAHHLQ